MKKLVLLLAMALTVGNLNAQLEVVKSETETIWSSRNSSQSLKHFITEQGDFYAFYYKNLEYKSITDIKYLKLQDKDEVVQFFRLVSEAIGSEQDTKVRINGKLVLLGDFTGGCIILTNGSHTVISKKKALEIVDLLTN